MLSRLRPRRREGQNDQTHPSDLGAETLAFLHANGIPTDPRYYALVHASLANRTSIAAHAIGEQLEVNGSLTREAADRIIAATGGDSGTSAAETAESQERLRHQTLHLADLAADARAATGQFNRDLSAGLDELDGDVRSVAGMVASMIERSRATEQQLAAAAEQIEQLRDELAEARNDALRDALTGLLNRRGVLEAVAALDPGRVRTVAVCDIDAFKAINDGHGHEVGDRILRVVADSLAQGCTPHLVGRWGGEEFIVVLDEDDPDVAAAIVDHVRSELAARSLRVRETGASLGRVTFSGGIASFDADSFDAALRVADRLLYQAKVAGRNRVLTDTPAAKAA